LAFVIAQGADDVPNKEDHHLHGAGANIGPLGLPRPPRLRRWPLRVNAPPNFDARDYAPEHQWGRSEMLGGASASVGALSLSAPLCLQSAKHVAGSQDQKADQQEREPAVDIRDAEMSVVNNCGDQGNNDRDTESDDLGC
jgi:hypothetical protein